MKVLDKELAEKIKTVEKQYPLGSFMAHAEIKAVDTDKRFIEGFASTNAVDRHDDIVDPEAFRESLGDFNRNPVLLAFHDHQSPIGKVIHTDITDKGLFIKAQISKTEDVLWTKIQEGILKALSIGFRITDRSMEMVDGNEVMRITGLKLFEISVVSVPANQEALFNIAKAASKGTDFVCKNRACKSTTIKTTISEDIIKKACDSLRNELEPQIQKAQEINRRLQSQLEKYQAAEHKELNKRLVGFNRNIEEAITRLN